MIAHQTELWIYSKYEFIEFICSDENTAVNHSSTVTQETADGWRRPRSESSADAESVYMTNAVISDSGYAHGMHSRRSSVSHNL